jgi:hypothetical protein
MAFYPKDCLDYVDKNQFQINIMYSGRRKRERAKKSDPQKNTPFRNPELQAGIPSSRP